jgi:hypothetical protein
LREGTVKVAYFYPFTLHRVLPLRSLLAYGHSAPGTLKKYSQYHKKSKNADFNLHYHRNKFQKVMFIFARVTSNRENC